MIDFFIVSSDLSNLLKQHDNSFLKLYIVNRDTRVFNNHALIYLLHVLSDEVQVL